MRSTTTFLVALGFGAAALYGFGLYGAQNGWFWTVDGVFDADDIGGTVSGPDGPEAGVWVIAELSGAPGKLTKIVVTDDRGRYVLPDLPNATFDVWVRGSGLIDSDKVQAQPGQMLNLTAKGPLAKEAPPRTMGAERNLVLTISDWLDPASAPASIGDLASADKRNPRLNANGPLAGVPETGSELSLFDPKTGAASAIALPVRDPDTRQALFDGNGRVWITARIRAADNPAFCKRGSQHPSAKLFPLATSDRQLAAFDLNTKQFTLIDTCFTTDRMAFDGHGVLWFGAGPRPSDVVGWFDTRSYDASHDAAAAQGWTAIIADTNGNSQRDAYVEPADDVDMTKDKRFRAGFSDVAVAPDGAVWGSVPGIPGAIVRLDPGGHPPMTALAEYYSLPAGDDGVSARGLDVDSQGVVWVAPVNGQLASFDRRKCKGPFYGPDATGAQCREGWTLYPLPGAPSESGYSVYADRFDTLGLGRDTPILTANASDALTALVAGKMVTLRVPYPAGVSLKTVDGRIDDPGAGWKGKGLWSVFAGAAVQHSEGGEGQTGKLVHFQLRPDPLAH